MNPIHTSKTTGTYGAPIGLEGEIGGLPYYREPHESIDTHVVFSVWEPSELERAIIFFGGNILVGQVGEPIRPMSVETTDSQKVKEDGTKR